MNFDNLMNYEYMHNSWIQLILITVKTNQQQHKKIMLIECKMQNNQLFYYDNLVVLNFKSLQFKIFEFAHNVVIVKQTISAVGAASLTDQADRRFFLAGGPWIGNEPRVALHLQSSNMTGCIRPWQRNQWRAGISSSGRNGSKPGCRALQSST